MCIRDRLQAKARTAGGEWAASHPDTPYQDNPLYDSEASLITSRQASVGAHLAASVPADGHTETGDTFNPDGTPALADAAKQEAAADAVHGAPVDSVPEAVYGDIPDSAPEAVYGSDGSTPSDDVAEPAAEPVAEDADEEASEEPTVMSVSEKARASGPGCV